MSTATTPGSFIELTHFAFPDLDDDHANFRFQVDLRYRKSNGDFTTKSVIMPGLSSYWECSKEENDKRSEKDRKQKDEYKRLCVRKLKGDAQQNSKNGEKYDNQIDVEKLDFWDKSFRVNSTHLYELRVSVFDVDRDDWYDKLVDTFKGAMSILTSVPVLGGALEPFIEGAASSVGSELTRSDDKVLFVKSSTPKQNSSGCIYELSKDGDFNIKFEIKTVDADVSTNQQNEGALS